MSNLNQNTENTLDDIHALWTRMFIRHTRMMQLVHSAKYELENPSQQPTFNIAEYEGNTKKCQ